MKLLEIFRSNDSKFFSLNSRARTVKAGYVYFEDKRVWIPSDTLLTIEYFDVYKNKVRVLIDGRQVADVTYEYLMDCVVPINADTSTPVMGVQLLQRVNHIISNETFVKLICLALVFSIGIIFGKLF